ncbi:MAG: hypothetical protein GF317_12690, partial [Candidatus Lokiarchaeota archaeon]|nr:hypothetical protein [Candidatus Lokiarchaeota archaeon]
MIEYDSLNEPLVISKATIDILLREKDFHNLFSLYIFYYYTGKWQKTTKIKCTNTYTSKGLGWGICKVKEVKKRLTELGFIQSVVDRDENGRVKCHYIYVKFLNLDSYQRYGFHTSGYQRYGFTTGGETMPQMLYTNRYNNKDILQSEEERKVPRKFYKISKILSRILMKKKNISISNDRVWKWSEHIYRLYRIEGIPEKRMIESLNFYEQHIGDKYIPVIESGRSFREKFLKLESAMDREGWGKEDKDKDKEEWKDIIDILGDIPIEYSEFFEDVKNIEIFYKKLLTLENNYSTICSIFNDDDPFFIESGDFSKF